MSDVPLCGAEDLCKSWTLGERTSEALRGVSLQLFPGEFVLLMGPSGSGKSTLLAVLAGLLRPTSGRVALAHQWIHAASEEDCARLRRKSLGFVFQQCHLFRALSALDNVAEVLVLQGHSRRQARERAERELLALGIDAFHLPLLPHMLSGGQKQRVAVARALAGDPLLLFGDEPTASLDQETATSVLDAVKQRSKQKRDGAVLLVTHDHRLKHYADRVLYLQNGTLRDESKA